MRNGQGQERFYLPYYLLIIKPTVLSVKYFDTVDANICKGD